MDRSTQRERSKRLLAEHLRAYPEHEMQDIFKFIFQSTFGCEHMVSSEDTALEYIRREYLTVPRDAAPLIEPLDGDYSRVWLSRLNCGLSAQTLARLFCLSAKKEEALLAPRLEAALELARECGFERELTDALGQWEAQGYPAVHHSERFRRNYHPAYRVLHNRYADFLQIFTKIDTLLSRGSAIVAIEGGSASGKSTLSLALKEVYDCNIIHMDDFFLRPEQRTSQRLEQVGGNIDRERFCAEVLDPLKEGERVTYRPFDCSVGALSAPVALEPRPLTVVEGVYSIHPAFGRYYDASFFLYINKEEQRARILTRNSPAFAARFFNEWIPLEDKYFSLTGLPSRADEVINTDRK